MALNRDKFRPGLTVTELCVSTAMGLILALGLGSLLLGGQRAWQGTLNSAHGPARQDAQTLSLAFSTTARKSNRNQYKIYNIENGVFTQATPSGTTAPEVVCGDAVELRYWDVDLNMADTQGLLDTGKTATAYTLFYMEGTTLKADYGPYPPAAVSEEGVRNTQQVNTVVLAENVSPLSGLKAFSHTVVNGTGRGCVRLHVTINDQATSQSISVTVAALLRNKWPK